MATAYLRLSGENGKNGPGDREFVYSSRNPSGPGWIYSGQDEVADVANRNEDLGYDPDKLDPDSASGGPRVPYHVITIGTTLGQEGRERVALLDGQPVDMNALRQDRTEVTEAELVVGSVIVDSEVHIVPPAGEHIGAAVMTKVVVFI